MPLDNGQQNQISNALAICKKIVTEFQPQIQLLNYNWNGAPGWSASIQQADLDAVAQFKGITKAQLTNAIAALTGSLTTAFSAAQSNLNDGATRG